jgi:hypothetical protein
MLRPRVLTAVAPLLALGLVVGACSSDDDGGGGTASPATGRTRTTGSGAATGGAHGTPLQFLGHALQPFGDCDALLGWLHDEATDRVTAYGLPGVGGPVSFCGPTAAVPAIGATESRAGATDAAAPAPADAAGSSSNGIGSGGAPGVDFSGTNVQEAGVDEPDLVKTDGHLLVTAVEGVLHVVDVSGAEPTELGRLRLPYGWDHQVLLSGTRALVLAAANSGDVSPADERTVPGYGGGSIVTTLVDVDLSDPTHPRIDRSLAVDGAYLSARQVGTTARVVVSAAPTGLVFETPQTGGLRAERQALEHNQQVIADSTLDDWLPYAIVRDGDGDVESEGTLLDCDQLARPQSFSGFGTLTVLTVDLADGLSADGGFGLFADGQTVYASADHLVVASNPWTNRIGPWIGMLPVEDAVDAADIADDGAESDGADEVRTDLHMFDIGDPATTSYVGSGSVPGTLLGQFALSDFEGSLRVASTTQPVVTCCTTIEPVSVGAAGPATPVAAPAAASAAAPGAIARRRDVAPAPAVPESMVTVLQPRDGELVQVGQVGGLGKGQQIYAVRMIGDVGYVVTFQRTDPLYTLDLSDPTAPEVVGELEIPGYSAYLHPVGDGLLLGIGQDATDSGRVTGAQVSLFDVSDPANPTRLDQVSLGEGGSSSTVEYDHRAFLYWAPSGLAVLPVTQWPTSFDGDGKPSADGFFGAVGLRVDTAAKSLETVGEIDQQTATDQPWDGRSQILRSLVVGDHVLTLAPTGILQSELTTLQPQGSLDF